MLDIAGPNPTQDSSAFFKSADHSECLALQLLQFMLAHMYMYVHVCLCLYLCLCPVIDLSSIEPESLGPLHLEEIPLCSFTEKGRPYKPKAKKNKKKLHKDEEHRARKKGEGQDGERRSKKERRVVSIAYLFV